MNRRCIKEKMLHLVRCYITPNVRGGRIIPTRLEHQDTTHTKTRICTIVNGGASLCTNIYKPLLPSAPARQRNKHSSNRALVASPLQVKCQCVENLAMARAPATHCRCLLPSFHRWRPVQEAQTFTLASSEQNVCRRGRQSVFFAHIIYA